MILCNGNELLLCEHVILPFFSLQTKCVYNFMENNTKSKKIPSSLDFSTVRVRNKYRYTSLNDGDMF